MSDSKALEPVREALYDRDAEIGVVAYAMDSPSILEQPFASRLRPVDFHDLDLRLAFEAVRKVVARGLYPSAAAVAQTMHELAPDEPVGIDGQDLETWRSTRVRFAPEADVFARTLLVLSEARHLEAELGAAAAKLHKVDATDKAPGYLTLAVQGHVNQLIAPATERDEYTAADLAAIEDESDPFLVPGVLQDAGVNILWGRGGEGKTIAALDLTLKVLTGGQAFGGTVGRTGAVLYLGADVDRRTMKDRLRRMKTGAGLNGHELPGFLFVRAPLNFADPGTFQYVVSKVHEIAGTHPTGKCALVVIDSWAAYMYGLDENSNSDVVGVMNQLRLLAERTGACILIVHHVNKNDLATGTNKGRGASAMPNSADAVLELTTKGNAKLLSHAKARNCIPMQPLTFEIGSDGDALTAEYRPASSAEMGEVMAEICMEKMAELLRAVEGEPKHKQMLFQMIEQSGGTHATLRTKDRAWALLKKQPGFRFAMDGKSASVVFAPDEADPAPATVAAPQAATTPKPVILPPRERLDLDL